MTRTREFRRDRGRPPVAFFSPFPPRKSGVSDYSAFLVEELRKTYQVDLYHDAGYVPETAFGADDDFSCVDYRLFERVAAAKNYHSVVFQMGNSPYHHFMYPLLHKVRGVVTLHDFCLVGFHLHYGRKLGVGLGLLRGELLRWYPEDRDAILRSLDDWGPDGEAIVPGCVRNGWYLNRGVLDASDTVIVHSPWCLDRVEAGSPAYADRVKVIRHGIHPKRPTGEFRAEVRRRFGLAGDALVVASFGFVHPDKMSPQALDAFAVVAARHPKAVFLFVGEEADGGAVRRHADSLGLGDRARFLGRQPAEAFSALIAATDVGVNLRLPPTNGETSGALLNLLASGVATVVTDVATFADYPEGVVRRVRWDSDGQPGLLRALTGLCDDPAGRGALGRAARDYVERHHEWSRVTRLYVDAIEESHARLAGGPSTRNRPHVRPSTTAANPSGAR